MGVVLMEADCNKVSDKAAVVMVVDVLETIIKVPYSKECENRGRWLAVLAYGVSLVKNPSVYWDLINTGYDWLIEELDAFLFRYDIEVCDFRSIN